MLTCSVCHMVLSESRVCSLCGSKAEDSIENSLGQESTDSVDLPFGLGDEPSQEQPSLPFGIDNSPKTAKDEPLEGLGELGNSGLPFGLVHAQESTNSEPEMVEEIAQKNSLPFGIEDAPPENKQNSQKITSKSSNKARQNLPFGTEHIFDSTQK